MGGFFQRLILGLGVFFGLLSPQNPPVLNFRFFRNEASILCSAQVAGAVNEPVRELVLSGNPLRLHLRLSFESGGEPVRVDYTHEIRYDVIDGSYRIALSETGSTHELQNQEAAETIFDSFYNLPIIAVADFSDGGANVLSIEAWLELPEETERDVMILWNYERPSAASTFRRLTELPR